MEEAITKAEKVESLDIMPRSGDPRDVLRKLIQLGDDGVFFVPSCPLCTSTNRQEAEKVFENAQMTGGSRFVAARDFLIAKGETLTLDIVEHHFSQHKGHTQLALRRAEYIDMLCSTASVEMSSLDRLKLMMALQLNQMMATSEMEPPANSTPSTLLKFLAQKNRDFVALSKAFCQATELKARLQGEMSDRGDLLQFPEDRFNQVFLQAAKEAKDETQKKLLIDVFAAITKLSEN